MGRNRDRITLTALGSSRMLGLPPAHHPALTRYAFLADLRRGEDVWPSGWLVRAKAGGPLLEITAGPAPGSYIQVAVPQDKAEAALAGLRQADDVVA